MTPSSFHAWRVRLYGERGVKAAADALGCSRTSVKAWETGTHKIPLYIALACQALANGLPPMQ
jgi:DNA-binding XRE family transcriptional regulator